MATVKVEKNSYTVEPLYQWDKDQTLEIYGLSLASIPEVHFANAAMSRAVVRQASMDAAGVVRVEVPNSMLQKPYTIQVYICTYAGSTFETQYKLELPVKARTQPADYTLEDDQEVYSFNALENQVVNALAECRVAEGKYNAAVTAQKEAKTAYENAKNEVDAAVDEAVDTAMDGIMTTLLSDTTKAKFGMGAEATADDVFSFLGNFNQHCWVKKKREETVAKGDRIPMVVSNIDSLIFSISTNQGSASFAIEYADEVTVTDSLTLELVNPKTVNLSLNTYSNANILKGKYVKRMIRNNAHALVDSQGNGEIVFIPADSVDANNSNGSPVYFNSQLGGAVFVIAMDVQELSGSVQYGEKEYLFSENPDAYPDGSVVDGFAYQYCGVPYENAASVVKIATGSYTGTGTYGKRNPNSLTFDFVPKFVAFSSTRYTAFGYLLNPGTSACLCGNATESDQTVTWNNKTVSWYSDDAHGQLNYTNTEYYYIAIS